MWHFPDGVEQFNSSLLKSSPCFWHDFSKWLFSNSFWYLACHWSLRWNFHFLFLQAEKMNHYLWISDSSFEIALATVYFLHPGCYRDQLTLNLFILRKCKRSQESTVAIFQSSVNITLSFLYALLWVPRKRFMVHSSAKVPCLICSGVISLWWDFSRFT